jgi:hypothetical protein
MAYLRELTAPRCQTCSKPARFELVNRVNAPLGKYCKKCAERKLAEQQRSEQVRRLDVMQPLVMKVGF